MIQNLIFLKAQGYTKIIKYFQEPNPPCAHLRLEYCVHCDRSRSVAPLALLLLPTHRGR